MSRRIPASERTREGLRDLIEGRLSSQSGRNELVQLATRLIIEEGLVAEVRDAPGRDYDEHGGEPGDGYRNGVRGGRLKTAEGFIDYSAPRVAGSDAPFRSRLRGHLKGNSEALENLAIEMQELSALDIEDAFRDESGWLLLPRTAGSELGERLWADYQEFATRDLNEYEISYLFVDGITQRIRPEQRREPVLAAWGLAVEGKKVLPSLMAGSKEDAETVSAFYQDMRARGLNDPLLVVSDGAAGIIKAIETCFPRSARQRCLAHRMRNLSAKVLEDVWPDFTTRGLAAGLPSAVACFQDDFEAMIAHLRLPVTHRRATRTTNLLERLFLEPAAEDHSQRVRREGGAQADVRGHDQSRRTLARRQDHRVRAPSDGRPQGRTRPGIRGRKRPQTKRLNRKPQARLSSMSRT